MTVRLFLFGSPMIEYRGDSVVLPFERRVQLVALLALRRTWVGRAELAAMFWPEQTLQRAYTNLRKTLFRLQAAPWASGVELQGSAIRFAADTDVSAFEIALREHRLGDALSLRRGELLAGFDDGSNEAWTSWLQFERDRLRGAWRSVALDRLSARIDPAEGIELSAQLMESDPLDEAALRAHMSWLAQAGQGARARQAYRDFCARLAADLGIDPGADLRALYDSLGKPAAAPAPARRMANDDGFIGRSTELRHIATLMAQDDCRLMCLTGPGGVGKTRLAQHAIPALEGDFPDGVAFIPLENVSSRRELGSRLARDLGGGQSLEHAIEFLRERRMLLVLDNFEHLAAEVSLVGRLLESCPGVKVMVTSRVRLAAPGEWVLALEGMPCPEAEDQDRIEAFDAARLFVKAARRVEPGLIPAAEARSIVDICGQVEGLPLALELAAAWTRVLSCEQIATELRQGTELLRAVGAAHPARHASFEVVFDQSWQLLTPLERDALACLSVFRGGFSAEAARAVAGASLPVLGALADKSLLRKEDGRLFLHPLVQQLAAVRLGEGEARAAAEKAHAAFFHRLMAQLRHPVESADRDALQRLDVELENCRLALRWALTHGAVGMLPQIAPTLFYFCEHRGRFELGLGLLGEVLESPLMEKDRKLQAVVHAMSANLVYRLDRFAQAEADARHALDLARRARDSGAQGIAFQVLGTTCFRLGRFAEARDFFDRGRANAEARGDALKVASMVHNAGLATKAMGHHEEARRIFIEVGARFRTLGDASGEARSLLNLSVLEEERDELDAAMLHAQAALAICERHGIVNALAFLLANLTVIFVKRGDHAAAREHGKRALEIAGATGNRVAATLTKLQFAYVELARNDLEAARRELQGSMEIAISLAQPGALLDGVTGFAEILLAQGEPECAARLLQFVIAHPSLREPLRDAARARLARIALPEAPGPALELDELAHRIFVETSVAHRPLIAYLRGTKGSDPGFPSGANGSACTRR